MIGAGKQMIGTVMEAVGKLAGDAKSGDAKSQAEGKPRNDVGSAKDMLPR